ncbi:MAG: hypothetical protein NTW96_20310 [Planctomycetia bacterium]|nr:hypothetical protein [Planctomycetia bacterium]
MSTATVPPQFCADCGDNLDRWPTVYSVGSGADQRRLCAACFETLYNAMVVNETPLVVALRGEIARLREENRRLLGLPPLPDAG